MLRRNYFLLVVFLMSARVCAAQLPDVRYSGIINTGAAFGSNNTKLQVQTIHGIRTGTWFAGAGASIDDYFSQSFPVFIDIRKDIFKRFNSPFIYAEGGVNLMKENGENKYTKIDNQPGPFYEAGGGYKIGINDQLALNLSAGYSFKSYSEEGYTKEYGPYGQAVGEWMHSTSNQYLLRRFVLKVGIQF